MKVGIASRSSQRMVTISQLVKSGLRQLVRSKPKSQEAEQDEDNTEDDDERYSE